MQDLTLKEIIASYREAITDELDVPLWVRMVISFFENHPQPAWIKAVLSPDGRLHMVRVNRAYQNQIGISPEQYQGEQDSALWDEETVKVFEANDRRVIESMQPVSTSEIVVNPLTLKKQRWIGWKWPIFIGDEVVAVCGCAYLDSGYDPDASS